MSFRIFQSEKKPFQAIKTRSSKTQKIDILQGGLTHCCGPKMAIFSTFFFRQMQARKMSFMIFQNEITPFQSIKTGSSESRKIDVSAKGLTHGFGQKVAIFKTFFFRQYRPGKCFLPYSRKKKRLSRLQKQVIQKVDKLTFFQRGKPMVLLQKLPFFKLFFSRQYRPGKCILRYSRTKKRLSKL